MAEMSAGAKNKEEETDVCFVRIMFAKSDFVSWQRSVLHYYLLVFGPIKKLNKRLLGYLRRQAEKE